MNEKIVSAKQFETGNVPSQIFDNIKHLNENPIFNPDTKPYKFVAKMNSDTRNHGWHFSVGEDYYLAMQHRCHGATECISLYRSDKKQSFDSGWQPIKQYITYVNVEHVVDMFVQEELGLSLIEITETEETINQ